MNRSKKKDLKYYDIMFWLSIIFVITFAYYVLFLSDINEYNIILKEVTDWNINLLIGVLFAIIVLIVLDKHVEEFDLKETISLWGVFSLITFGSYLISTIPASDGVLKAFIGINTIMLIAIVFYVKDFLFKLFNNKKNKK